MVGVLVFLVILAAAVAVSFLLVLLVMPCRVELPLETTTGCRDHRGPHLVTPVWVVSQSPAWAAAVSAYYQLKMAALQRLCTAVAVAVQTGPLAESVAHVYGAVAAVEVWVAA